MKHNNEISSVGSERLPYKQRVGGSTPSAPTTRKGKSKQNPEVAGLRDFLFMAGGQIRINGNDHPDSALTVLESRNFWRKMVL